MSLRKPWKDELAICVMMVCSAMSVRPGSLRGYLRFAKEVRRGERLYRGQMFETHVLELVEKHVRRGKVREVLREIATQIFCIHPKATLQPAG